MSSMAPDGPSPQAAGAAQSGSYPTNNDPAMQPLGIAAMAIQKFIAAEPDPQLKAMGAKLLAECHSILASGEKQHDAAIGLSPQLKFIQRQQAMAQGGGQPQAAPQGAPDPNQPQG